jgi:PPOX class probable F420-dependent enzyme
MPVVPADIAGLLASRQNGTLATLRRDGRPQLSVVTYAWYPHDPDDGGREIVRISTVDGRAKVANLRRDPRASFLVSGASGWSYAVVEGTVDLSPVATFHDDETVEELVRIYRDAAGRAHGEAGEHPDWADYRRAMVDDHRLVARLVVEHAYGLVRS